MTWRFYPARDFARLPGDWEKLRVAAGHSGLMRVEFVAPLLASFASGEELVAVRHGTAGIDAMAVLVRRRYGFWETFQPSQAPMGLWMHHPVREFASLLEELTAALPGFALGVAVTQQDPDLVAEPSSSGTCTTLEYIRTARVSITGRFEDYWSRRGKNLRQNVKRQKSTLAKEGITAHLDVITAPEDIAQAVSDYGRLENAGWKAQLGTAISEENAQGRFYVDMLRSFAQRGAARIFRYRFNDRVTAVDMCIVSDDELVVLKTTYDESIHGVSPATLLRHDYFATVFAEGQVKRIEFYGRLMDWHLRWTDEVRTLYHVNSYRWAWLQKLRALLTRRAESEEVESRTRSENHDTDPPRIIP